jgi:hypothetical protein
VKGIPVISADQQQNIVWQLPHNIYLEDLQRDLQLHWGFSLPNNILLEDLIRA